MSTPAPRRCPAGLGLSASKIGFIPAPLAAAAARGRRPGHRRERDQDVLLQIHHVRPHLKRLGRGSVASRSQA
ncbi:MAG: hypothetical protein WKF73_19590 [Nocardioidaceae bacterium]